MSMQLSDEELLEDSKLPLTDNDSVRVAAKMGAGDSLSMPEPNISRSEQRPESMEQRQQPVTMIDGELEYKVTKDRYVGQIDPVTKLRHGQGCYTYKNPFF